MSAPVRLNPRGRAHGSGLLEVLISMGILALAAVGAVMGMVAATRDVKDGQVLQGRRMLLEARVQRLWLAVKPTGEVEPMTGVPANTPCLDSIPDAVLPKDVYCREILVTKGLPRDLPLASQALVPAGALPFTVWTRVFRKGDSLERAIVHSEVFVQ
ncbi:MAG: type II secretion system protein [Myxococcaceae bacterium]|nr:MAG: type II secretion system protein [Myxococcaceae bacterium]